MRLNKGRARALLLRRGGITYAAYIASLAPLAIWPMNETSGGTADDAASTSTARDGAYSNVTLNADTFVKGGVAGSWNGTTSYMDMYTASLAAAFVSTLGSVFMWGKVSAAGVWSDGTTRLLLRLGADATNNLIQLDKLGATGALRLIYIAGGTVKSASTTVTPTTWFSVALTWNKASDRVRGYYNGAQLGADLTGLGVWAGALATAQCTVGSGSTTPSNVWSGGLSHVAVWDRELTAAEVLSIST